MCFSLKVCLICIILLSKNNNNNVISVGYDGVKNLRLDITSTSSRTIFISRAFTLPLKPHNTLYKEHYYYINLQLAVSKNHSFETCITLLHLFRRNLRSTGPVVL